MDKTCCLPAFFVFIIFFISGISVFAQETPNAAGQLVVKGQVTAGDTGEPLPGATIRVEGTSGGTITDLEGQFSIEVPDNSSVLIVSFISYQTERIPVNSRTTIEVALSPDISELEEVVVVGYGVQKRSNITF